jgi:hypothetical protein
VDGKMATAALNESEQKIASLLASRYGDGVVYIPRNGAKSLFFDAMANGFISEDGFVTRKGRALLARAGSGTDLRG